MNRIQNLSGLAGFTFSAEELDSPDFFEFAVARRDEAMAQGDKQTVDDITAVMTEQSTLRADLLARAYGMPGESAHDLLMFGLALEYHLVPDAMRPAIADELRQALAAWIVAGGNRQVWDTIQFRFRPSELVPVANTAADAPVFETSFNRFGRSTPPLGYEQLVYRVPGGQVTQAGMTTGVIVMGLALVAWMVLKK